MTEAPRRRLYNDGLVWRFDGEGPSMKAPICEGESEAAARVCEKIAGEERAPLALTILALYRQAEIYKRPLGGVSFTCHFNGASWASSRGLGPYEYGMSQQSMLQK